MTVVKLRLGFKWFFTSIVNRTQFRLAYLLVGLVMADVFISLVHPSTSAYAQSLRTRAEAKTGVNNPGLQLQEQIRDSTNSTPNFDPSEESSKTESDNVNDSSTDGLVIKDPTFFFKAIRFQGNTMYDDELLTDPFLDFIGEDITFQQ